VRVKAFLDRPIEGDWPYVWVDATYLKVRQAGRIVLVAVTIAVGVNGDGVAKSSAWRSARRRPRRSGPTFCGAWPDGPARCEARHLGCA